MKLPRDAWAVIGTGLKELATRRHITVDPQEGAVYMWLVTDKIAAHAENLWVGFSLKPAGRIVNYGSVSSDVKEGDVVWLRIHPEYQVVGL